MWQVKKNCKNCFTLIHPPSQCLQPIDEEVDIRKVYQIQNNKYYTEPNIYGELHLGNQDSVGYNSNIELYYWEVKNYETQEWGCCTI